MHLIFPDAGNILLFIAAGLALNVTPGPDMLYTIARTAAQGRWAGIVSALGISSGCLVHVAAATFGLSAILSYSALTFQIVKYAGAGYLIYLGVRMLLSRGSVTSTPEVTRRSLRALFWQGAVTNILNPKVALFFLSFLPQFINPERGGSAFQIFFLGMVFICNGTLVLIAIVFSVSWLGRLVGASERSTRWLSRGVGWLFIGLGARLAFSDK